MTTPTTIDLEAFVQTCRDALGADDAGDRVADAMAPIVADRAAMVAEIDRRRADKPGPVIIHRSDELTVLALDVDAGFVSPIHNHTIWAVVGVFQGAEDNVFYRRTATGIEETGRGVLHEGDCLALPPDAVHRIANYGNAPMRALHAYGGDLFATQRSQWNEATGEESPFGR